MGKKEQRLANYQRRLERYYSDIAQSARGGGQRYLLDDEAEEQLSDLLQGQGSDREVRFVALTLSRFSKEQED